MIVTLLLIIIYLAFISLGLPDAILGSAWPDMSQEFGMSIDKAGYVSIVISISTVMSSLLSGYIIDKIGTGKVITISIFLTAGAILGMSFVPSYFWLVLLAFPLGFGAGSIDTALNNYVALHYKAFHMNWLHAFWGVGATMGPAIISLSLASATWRKGYLWIAGIQIVLLIISIIALPLWTKVDSQRVSMSQEKQTYERPKNLLKIKGVYLAVSIFIVYCAIEFSVGLWSSSYLVEIKNFTSEIAARVVAIYYLGITVGRFISGFISIKLNNKQMIYLGIIITFIGTLLLNFNLSQNLTFIPYGIIGLGLAPIFPAMIHETPNSFGKENSQHIIGYQMAGAYIGASIFPPLFGIIAKVFDIKLYPYYLLLIGILLLILVNALFIRVKKN